MLFSSSEHLELLRYKDLVDRAIKLLSLTNPHDTCSIPCNCAALGPFEHCDWHKMLRDFENMAKTGRLKDPSGLRRRDER